MKSRLAIALLPLVLSMLLAGCATLRGAPVPGDGICEAGETNPEDCGGTQYTCTQTAGQACVNAACAANQLQSTGTCPTGQVCCKPGPTLQNTGKPIAPMSATGRRPLDGAAAQASMGGKIEATVKDASGNPLGGAKVTLYTDSLNEVRATDTARDGKAVFANELIVFPENVRAFMQSSGIREPELYSLHTQTYYVNAHADGHEDAVEQLEFTQGKVAEIEIILARTDKPLQNFAGESGKIGGMPAITGYAVNNPNRDKTLEELVRMEIPTMFGKSTIDKYDLGNLSELQKKIGTGQKGPDGIEIIDLGGGEKMAYSQNSRGSRMYVIKEADSENSTIFVVDPDESATMTRNSAESQYR